MSLEKKDLIALIDDAIVKEEKSIVIYNKHIKTAIFWAGLKEPIVQQIRSSLDILTKESERHASILLKLKADVESEDKNVY